MSHMQAGKTLGTEQWSTAPGVGPVRGRAHEAGTSPDRSTSPRRKILPSQWYAGRRALKPTANGVAWGYQVAEARFALELLAFRLDSRTRVTPVAPKSIRFAPPPHEQNLLVPLLPEEVEYSA